MSIATIIVNDIMSYAYSRIPFIDNPHRPTSSVERDSLC